MNAVDPDYLPALAALHEGRPGTCHTLAGNVLERDPLDGPAQLLRAVTCHERQAVLANALHAASCRNAPLDAESWFNYGVLLEREHQRMGALDAYRRAILLDPLHEGALLNGTQLIRVHEFFDEALALSYRLQRMRPDCEMGYTHAAISLQHMGRLDESDQFFAMARERASDPTLLDWEHHFSLLARKLFRLAWQKYETRFACGRFNGVNDMAFALPRWEGGAADHVLVYAEQGIGDQLMFACALPDLSRRRGGKRGGRISLAVAPPLVALMAASFPDVQVVEIGNGQDPAECSRVLMQAGRVVPVDRVLPLGTLMTHFRNDLQDFTGKPYLRPSPQARDYWRRHPLFAGQRVSGKAGQRPLRVGLCWASNPAPDLFHSARRARHKTMPLAVMAQLARLPQVEAFAITNVALSTFSDASAADLAIHDLSASLVDLDRTAGLLEHLDLLVTVDTGVAHLAGALGVPVWVLLHTGGDARWGQWGECESYWYGAARILWQQTAGDWEQVIARVAGDLAKLGKARRGDGR